MSNPRFSSIENAYNRKKIDVKRPSAKISDYYAKNVFTLERMQEYLSKDAYKNVLHAIKTGEKITRETANQVASAMKSWAISRGATHHTHWFQPLTGLTAEKHDTFWEPSSANEQGIETFSGNTLVQGEPDGSSFPSGGLRDTHEARGYTAWDPSSPAFIIENGSHGRTLCIPTVFITYSGLSTDYKTPILKSQQFLNKAAVPICNYFDRHVTQVTPTLGWEQEYFLVDKSLYYARPDLVACGRTLIGRGPAKGQQLDDHYFGSIHERVYDFMLDMETEALKLGIPLKTRHNEVAPAQYEVAPVFDELNRAIDQNSLLMDLMDKVARRHDLRILFHEKPFAGLNGSGKHNNWSLATDTGKNLLSPGKTPRTNLLFLTFFINVIKAINEHSDLLRASIATAGNEHRLGANEAPPAIISVFIGSTLTRVLEELEKKVKTGKMDELEKADLKVNIHSLIPDLLLDNTDRNRTSPFAFTGNKFEFRAVGSSQNCALPMTVLNTIVGQQLIDFGYEVEKLIGEGEKKDGAILRVLRRYVGDVKKILFEGDNYSNDWEKEAKKRGLNNIKSTPHALDFLITEDAEKLFVENGILNKEELHARYEVFQEQYQMKIQIEGRILGEMVTNQVIPSAVKYMNTLVANIKGLEEIGLSKKTTEAQKEIAQLIAERVNKLSDLVKKMINAREKANKIEDASKKAKSYSENVKPFFDKIREQADRLELIIDDETWTLPKYRELLFIK